MSVGRPRTADRPEERLHDDPEPQPVRLRVGVVADDGGEVVDDALLGHGVEAVPDPRAGHVEDERDRGGLDLRLRVLVEAHPAVVGVGVDAGRHAAPVEVGEIVEAAALLADETEAGEEEGARESLETVDGAAVAALLAGRRDARVRRATPRRGPRRAGGRRTRATDRGSSRRRASRVVRRSLTCSIDTQSPLSESVRRMKRSFGSVSTDFDHCKMFIELVMIVSDRFADATAMTVRWRGVGPNHGRSHGCRRILRDSLTPFRGPLAERLRAPGRCRARRTRGCASLAAAAIPPTRCPCPPASDRSAVAGCSVDAPTAAAILARAEADLALPWPQPRAHDAARVHSDGDRDTWEQAAFERQRRLSRAVVAAAVTIEDEWYAEVLDGVCAAVRAELLVLARPRRRLPRARRGARDGRRALTSTSARARSSASSRGSTTSSATGLEERYPGVRARIRREARVRVLEPFLRRRDWHWIGLDGDVHNWNPWIHGNVLVAALALLEADDPARAEIVALAIEGLDRYVAVLPDDGAIDEGYAYWWNGACRALEALDILVLRDRAAASTRSTCPRCARPSRSRTGCTSAGRGTSTSPTGLPGHLPRSRGTASTARRGGWETRMPQAHAAAHRDGAAATEVEGLGRLLRGMTDARVGRRRAGAVAASARRRGCPRRRCSSRATRAGSAAGLALAVKGGHNGEHHNHNDVGSFVVASDGVPVIVDAGRPTYTAQTFGPDRYAIWTMQSGWHNVPVIGGREQLPGREHAARDVARRRSRTRSRR